MRAEVSREIVSDLWALCRTGEASPESRALVDAFLAQDRELAAVLKRSEGLECMVPPAGLSPDTERRLLHQAASHARIKWLVIGGAVVMGAGIALISLIGLLFTQLLH